MPKPKDPTLIPPGNYCYRWVDLAPGEVASEAGPEFGRLQRECASTMPNTKQVLCSYFERTGYGTVRCLFLEQEVAFDFFRETIAPRVAARFGTPDAVDWFDGDSLLWDAIKVCRLGGDDDTSDADLEDGEPTD